MTEAAAITRQFLEDTDKKIELISLAFDVAFKSIFENNLDILKEFLILTLNLNLKPKDTKIQLLNNELTNENIKEYHKRIDIIVVLNDTIFIDIEMNRSPFSKVKLRNFMYCDKLYSMLIKSGDEPEKLRELSLYQLNLNTKDKSISYGEDIIVAYSLKTNKIFLDNKYIVLKYLEFYCNLYYTGVKLSKAEIWLASLTSKTFTELNEMLSKVLPNNKRERMIKEAIRMSTLDFNLHEWEKEKMDELVRCESKRIDKEEGIEQNTIDIVKEMIKNNIDLETISKVTKKTKDEIKNIQNNM